MIIPKWLYLEWGMVILGLRVVAMDDGVGNSCHNGELLDMARFPIGYQTGFNQSRNFLEM